jgi:hypothetical protein
VAVANLGSGCAIETSNLQVGTMELGVLFFGDKYCHTLRKGVVFIGVNIVLLPRVG